MNDRMESGMGIVTKNRKELWNFKTCGANNIRDFQSMERDETNQENMILVIRVEHNQ